MDTETQDNSAIFSSLNLFWFTSLVGVALILYQFYEQWAENMVKKRFEKQHIKFVRWGNIFFDTITRKNIIEKMHNFVQIEGSVFGIKMMGTKTIMLSDPALVQQVVSKNFSNFVNRRKIAYSDDIFKNMLFLAEDDNWKRFRTIMTPTFAHGKIKLMKGMIDRTTQLLLRNLEDSLSKSNDGIVEIKHVICAFTMDTIVQIAFGIKLDSLIDKENPVILNAKAIFQQDLTMRDALIWTSMVMAPKLTRLLRLRPLEKEMKFFAQLSESIVTEKRKQFEASSETGEKVKPTNFIELLIEAENECNKANRLEGKGVKYMTLEEIVSQCVLFFSVGFDTTATAVSVTCYELAKNPEYQTLVYEEIQQMFQKRKNETGNPNLSINEAFTIDIVGKEMPVLNAALSEALRIHSPVTFIERTAAEDITLISEKKEIHVQKDDVITIPIFSIHRDPSQHSDPLKFKPERFLNEKKFHEYSYMPFGAGPRTCIGKPLAYIEARIALVNIFNNFIFSKCSKTLDPMEYYYQGEVMVCKDVYLKVQKRR